MSRYIDADEIVYFNDTGENRPIEGALVAYKGQIDRIPAADVAPVVRGHWITVYREDGTKADKCSVCTDAVKYFDYKYGWCPHCGAKMDESEDNTDE